MTAMQYAKYVAIILILAGCLLTRAGADGLVVPDKTMIYKTVSNHGLGDTKLKLHLFTPKNHKQADRRPAIVFFFSGGWNVGSPSQFFPHCEYFATRGIVAISAEYRVKSRHNTSPRECVKDGKSAIRWIRRHADELGIDPNKLAAGGGSAGGQIATAAATVEGFNEEGEDLSTSCIPNALVLFNPAFDNGPKRVDDRPATLPERKRAGWGYDRVRAYWREFSPMHNIHENTPPTVVFLGAQDKYIPTVTAEEFRQRMLDKGLRCELHVYQGQPHEFYNVENAEYYVATVVEADRFLASLGYVQGAPTLQSKPNAGDRRR